MAKYSFEETTIGELLDNPKTAEFLFELVPEAKEALNQFKMEAANDFDVPLPS